MHSYNAEFSFVWAYTNSVLAAEKVREIFLRHRGNADYNFHKKDSVFRISVKQHLKTITMPENDFWEFEMEQAVDALQHLAIEEVEGYYKNDKFMLGQVQKERNENFARQVA